MTKRRERNVPNNFVVDAMPEKNNLEARDFLGQTLEVIIDRPAGSFHPRFNYIYPVNYGYIAGTMAPDGEEIDAYILGEKRPLVVFFGQCIAVIHRTDDHDDKLVVVAEGITLTDDEIRLQTEFQEQYFKSVIIRK